MLGSAKPPFVTMMTQLGHQNGCDKGADCNRAMPLG